MFLLLFVSNNTLRNTIETSIPRVGLMVSAAASTVIPTTAHLLIVILILVSWPYSQKGGNPCRGNKALNICVSPMTLGNISLPHGKHAHILDFTVIQWILSPEGESAGSSMPYTPGYFHHSLGIQCRHVVILGFMRLCQTAA